VAIGSDKNVGRLHVAVDDRLRVHVLEARDELGRHEADHGLGGRALDEVGLEALEVAAHDL
jgi:hypothetical protein